MIIPEASLYQINSSRDLRVREDQIFQPTTLRFDQTETTSALTVENQLLDRYHEDHPECLPSSVSHGLPFIYFSSEEQSTHENSHPKSLTLSDQQ